MIDEEAEYVKRVKKQLDRAKDYFERVKKQYERAVAGEI